MVIGSLFRGPRIVRSKQGVRFLVLHTQESELSKVPKSQSKLGSSIIKGGQVAQDPQLRKFVDEEEVKIAKDNPDR
jgi:hypothetical protein